MTVMTPAESPLQQGGLGSCPSPSDSLAGSAGAETSNVGSSAGSTSNVGSSAGSGGARQTKNAKRKLAQDPRSAHENAEDGGFALQSRKRIKQEGGFEHTTIWNQTGGEHTSIFM